MSSSSTKAKICSVAEKKLLDDKLLMAVNLGGWTTRHLCLDDYKFTSIQESKVYKPKLTSPEKKRSRKPCKSCSTVHSRWDMSPEKNTNLEKKQSPELCCESSSSMAKISSVAEKKLLDDKLLDDKLLKTVNLENCITRPSWPEDDKFTSIQESMVYEPHPTLPYLELKQSPELCSDWSSSKAKISSVPAKKLLADKLLDEKIMKTLEDLSRYTRPLRPDDYKVTSIKECMIYKQKNQPKLTSPEKKRSRKPCESCSTVHSRWDMSALESCSVCHCNRHLYFNCPYLAKFTLVCRCGCPFFDMDEWVCSSARCTSKIPMFEDKECTICGASDHTTYECTEAKHLAAKYKMSAERIYEVEASKRCKSA